jgi:hypothetical protein
MKIYHYFYLLITFHPTYNSIFFIKIIKLLMFISFILYGGDIFSSIPQTGHITHAPHQIDNP